MSDAVVDSPEKKTIRIILRHTPTGAHGESLEAVYKTVDIYCEELERCIMPRYEVFGSGEGLTVVGAELIDEDDSKNRLCQYSRNTSEDDLPFDDDTPF